MPATDTFDFEAFINGLDVDLPRFEVPLYRVVRQSRINELDAQIKAAAESEATPADDREGVEPAPDLVAERDRLSKEQEDSARWIELRSLTSQEFADLSKDDKDYLDQLAMQTGGTRNEMTREDWQKMQDVVLPGAFSLLLARANQIVEETLVMPDFSLNTSATKARKASSAS